jgi:hypothetical protein
MELELGEVIGEGGNAVVHRARQLSLDRDVAVKVPRSSTQARSVIREARVAGRLEHPSVPAIHELVEGPDGPRIVMRRVHGRTWAEVMDESGLEANLRVLGQVSHAVAFAHAHGVLHLDLKPENVMIGAFGEVFVLDWGLAAAAEGGPPELSPARDLRGPRGTPCFMAPEMLGDPAALREQGLDLPELPPVGPITERSDVFLLGGALYRILSGRAPHQGVGPAALYAVWAGRIPSPPGPAGLVRIAMQALARDPADRHSSATAFREALEDDAAADRVELALGRREAEEAAARLAGLHAPRADLEARVASLRRELEADRARLSGLDRRVGATSRRLMSAVAGLGFTVAPVAVAVADRWAGPRLAYPTMLLASDAILSLLVLMALALRRSLGRSTLNRESVALLGAAFGGQTLLDLAGWLRGMEPQLVMALHLLLLGAVCGVGAANVHRALAWAAAVFAAAFVLAMAWPGAVYTLTALTGLAFLAGLISAWWEGR